MNDTLTRLLERWTFLDIFQAEVIKANEREKVLALLTVENKNFNRINLLYRYSVGDQVLKSFAEILQQVARKQDFISRIGDWKFTLLLVDVSSEEHARMAAYKIYRLLEKVFKFEFESTPCAATVGIEL